MPPLCPFELYFTLLTYHTVPVLYRITTGGSQHAIYGQDALASRLTRRADTSMACGIHHLDVCRSSHRSHHVEWQVT
jgi:hypothetical protein